MPTDAELRTLFRESAAPNASIDTSAIIRRSRRRRLPQQLGVGSVLTLAVAGIGFASFTGLQGMNPSMTAADAPAGVAESGALFESDMSTRSTCASDTPVEGEMTGALRLESEFPDDVQGAQQVRGAVTLTNTGMEEIVGTVSSADITVTRADHDVHYRDHSAAGMPVSLPPGATATVAVTFEATGCGASDGTALEPGSYDLSAVLAVEASDGTLWRVEAPASAITIR